MFTTFTNACLPYYLILHEFLGVLPLFVRGLFEVLRKSMQSDVVSGKVIALKPKDKILIEKDGFSKRYHRQVDVVGVELHVDLLVDSGLAVGVEVLSDSGSHDDDFEFLETSIFFRYVPFGFGLFVDNDKLTTDTEKNS